MTAIQLWWLALAIAALVVVVVAALLGMIIAAAKSIDRHAAGIWTVGKQIAGNTVSIWMLEKTNDHLEGMTNAVRAVEKTTTSMEETLRSLTTDQGRS
jgi:hypothetical protein